jgi:hypothetical protein
MNATATKINGAIAAQFRSTSEFPPKMT